MWGDVFGEFGGEVGEVVCDMGFASFDVCESGSGFILLHSILRLPNSLSPLMLLHISFS